MQQKKILGVDFDEVLFQSTKAAVKYHNAAYGTSFTVEDMTSYNWGEIWGCTSEEAERRFIDFISTQFHAEAEEVLGARDALKRLNEKYEVVIVTGRQEIAREATLGWLTKNLAGLYREIHFVGSFNPDPSKQRLKSDVVKTSGISIFIDDSLRFAEDVARTGVPVLLFDTPWNQGEALPGVVRVRSWDEITRRLLVAG